MRIRKLFTIGLLVIAIVACVDDPYGFDEHVVVTDFNFPETVAFEKKLSAYNIYGDTPADLIPSSDFHLLELSSILFTDYAHKQRLVKVPTGTQMIRLNDGSIDFPDGSILVKTFFYYIDERDPKLGIRIIESRLLIKENDTWNVATYIWNKSQTDATLELNGLNTQVAWLDSDGNSRSTLYHVPNVNECGTCHQSNSKMTPLGPTLRNLNRNVERHEEILNQINHLQSLGLLNEFPVSKVSKIVDYKNSSASLAERGRAYLDMNCAHCHNPNGWEKSNQRRFDFRYETPLDKTGILSKKEKISRTLVNGRMPFIGTTMRDESGILLLKDYLNSL